MLAFVTVAKMIKLATPERNGKAISYEGFYFSYLHCGQISTNSDGNGRCDADDSITEEESG